MKNVSKLSIAAAMLLAAQAQAVELKQPTQEQALRSGSSTFSELIEQETKLQRSFAMCEGIPPDSPAYRAHGCN